MPIKSARRMAILVGKMLKRTQEKFCWLLPWKHLCQFHSGLCVSLTRCQWSHWHRHTLVCMLQGYPGLVTYVGGRLPGVSIPLLALFTLTFLAPHVSFQSSTELCKDRWEAVRVFWSWTSRPWIPALSLVMPAQACYWALEAVSPAVSPVTNLSLWDSCED